LEDSPNVGFFSPAGVLAPKIFSGILASRSTGFPKIFPGPDFLAVGSAKSVLDGSAFLAGKLVEAPEPNPKTGWKTVEGAAPPVTFLKRSGVSPVPNVGLAARVLGSLELK